MSKSKAQSIIALLGKLRSAIKLAKEKDIKNGILALGHHIHSLCIDPESNPKDEDIDIRSNIFFLLVKCSGLSNSGSLTIRLVQFVFTTEGYDQLKLDIWEAVQVQCLRLKDVRWKDLRGWEKAWLSGTGVFFLNVCCRSTKSFNVSVLNDFVSSSWIPLA